MDAILLGVDIGGTSTVAVAVPLDGREPGRGVAGPANPHSVEPSEVVAALRVATSDALSRMDPSRVCAGLVGMAGSVAAGRSPLAEALAETWKAEGIRCPIRVTGDTVVAFAAGSAYGCGQVVIAGTGAVAAEVTDWRVSRAADGLGWLLGDEGSGFWLGRQAVRHTVRLLHAGRPRGELDNHVIEYFGTSDPDEMTGACYRSPPPRLAELAEVVCAVADSGDSVARAITTEAGDRLAATRAELGEPVGPVVLSGGLLSRSTPVRRALLSRLDDDGLTLHDHAGATSRRPGGVRIANEAATGAAWLAGVLSGVLSGRVADDLHDRLTGWRA